MSLPEWVPEGGDGGGLVDIAGREAEASVDLHDPEADRARIRVRGEWLDDEPGHVLVTVDVGGTSVELSMAATEARSFASDIAEAARAVEEDGLDG